jgi:hypothetical protein
METELIEIVTCFVELTMHLTKNKFLFQLQEGKKLSETIEEETGEALWSFVPCKWCSDALLSSRSGTFLLCFPLSELIFESVKSKRGSHSL